MTYAGDTLVVVEECLPGDAEGPVLGAAGEGGRFEDRSKSVAVPSRFTWLRTLPAGPEVIVIVTIFSENSPIALPAAIGFSPCLSKVWCWYPIHCRSNLPMDVERAGQLKLPHEISFDVD
jgi:hypothetical protein